MSASPRTGQSPPKLERQAFHERFQKSFVDPRFIPLKDAIAEVEEVAWKNYSEKGHKAPLTEKAGAEFFNPDYELSVEWKKTRARLKLAELKQKNPASPSRVLLICASARNDGTCPSEVSKSWRMTLLAQDELLKANIEVDLLDLSLLTSGYDEHIHPCKACVSTAMPLCHWPCSCYPNHALRQTNDWMAEIYEQWVAAHGVIIFTPVYWYQTPGVLKLMIDRLVCADGGNPDPTRTDGKDAVKAKEIELAGWDYPKHLAGRTYGLVVHGDVAGIEGVRRGLSDWLDWMGLIAAGATARLDRYIGYYESYAESHDVFDRDLAMQEEVRNVARSVAKAVNQVRDGSLIQPDANLKKPRTK
jgi:multimeric flavodoxin WrbA